MHLYAHYFICAPLSTSSPRHDITLRYDLKSYDHMYDHVISQVAFNSIRRHLWYLCQELVVLALFYDIHTRQATLLRNNNHPQDSATSKAGQPNFNPIAALLTEEKSSLAIFYHSAIMAVVSSTRFRCYVAGSQS